MGEDKQYLNHRSRLRNRFRESGIDSLENYEKLELLLMYCVPVKDVKPMGKRLMKKFNNSISSVMDADFNELQKVKGVGPVSATLIKFVRDLMTTYNCEKMTGSSYYLNSPTKVVDFARLKIGALKNEVFMVIFLNTKNKVICHELILEGTIDSVPVYPRRLIKMAFDKNASSIILVHNHPSGDTEPSINDVELTKQIEELSISLDIRLLDHLIVSKDEYYSFSSNGRLSSS